MKPTMYTYVLYVIEHHHSVQAEGAKRSSNTHWVCIN